MTDEMNGPGPDGMPEPSDPPEAASAPPVPPKVPPAPPVPPMPAPAPEPVPSAPASAVPVTSDTVTRTRGMRAGGVVFGLLLVLAGVLALTGGVSSWFDLLRLWPLLIVLGGIMRMLNWNDHEKFIKRTAEGLGSVAFGLVLLGNTMGFIPWNVWFSIFSLWPLLLVAIGIELVGKGLHMDWIRALSNVVLILGLAYAVFVVQPSGGVPAITLLAPSGVSTPFSSGNSHDPGITGGTAEIKVGATKLSVTAGDDLVDIAGIAPASDQPGVATSSNGSETVVTVDDAGQRNVFVGTLQRTLNVKLDRAVAWHQVKLDVGAVTADVDLSGLRVEAVKMNVGASDARIKIGTKVNDVTVDISGGATSVTLLVPAGVTCTVTSTSGLSSVRVPPSFRQTSGIGLIGNSTYQSDGSTGATIDVTLASGVSDLRIETY